MTTAEDRYGTALQAAEDAYTRSAAQVEVQRRKAAEKAAGALQAAVDAHDEQVAQAEQAAAATLNEATAARADAIGRAEERFDDEMRQLHDAPTVRVVSSGGVHWLMDGRLELASATPVGGGHYRVTTRSGVSMVGSESAARARLWQVLADDPVSVR